MNLLIGRKNHLYYFHIIASRLKIIVCLFLSGQCVQVAGLERTVPGRVPAPTMAHATPSTAPASATPAGSEVTVPSVSIG